MKNSYSNIFTLNKKILKKTINNLNNNEVVGLPTETVYGLGGNAYSKVSVEKIYRLKGRPKSNPLIIHYYNLKEISRDININQNFKKLYKYLCPGPVTFILKRKKDSKINPLACAKLDTVAIRFPQHRITRSILKKISYPLAMPSANKSTNVSPVKAVDVIDNLRKKLKLLLMGADVKLELSLQ